MVPEMDPPPDYELIGNRKGKRASGDEKKEIDRLSKAGMSMQQLLEITQRSEDSIRRYIREVGAASEAAVRTQAEAYQHMVNPAAPAPAPAAPPSMAYVDDDDDEGEGGESTILIPAPPPPDLDDLFEDDDIVDPADENALSKKLYLLLVEKKAVKDEDDAADIARTFKMYPDFQNPHGLVEFLKGHDVKEKKANMISRLLFGWQQQQGQVSPFNPGPVPPGGYPQPMPGAPLPGAPFHPYQQQYGGVGQYTGYGQYPQQYPQQYPGYPPPPYPPVPAAKGVTKDDIKKIVDERDSYWQGKLKELDDARNKDDEKKAHKEEMDELRAANQALEQKVVELATNPPVVPDGDYVATEIPEHDEDGNVIRVHTKVTRLEDPSMKELRDRMERWESDMKEERTANTDALKKLSDALSAAETEKVKVEIQGKVSLLEAEQQLIKDKYEDMKKMREEMFEKDLAIHKLETKGAGELSENMQIANLQMGVAEKGLAHMRETRADLMKFGLQLVQGGKPEGAATEQWTDEEEEAWK